VTIIVVYSPTLTLLNTFPPRSGTSVAYSGAGWPPNLSYTLLFDGRPFPSPGVGGVTTAAGAIAGSFTVPPNTTPGAHTVTATAGAYSANASLTTQ
jgi:tetrahydromethanopterin S-methyltransferase subunit B